MRGIRVLGVAAVVERDPAELVRLCERGGRGRARLVHGGRLVLAPGGQDGLVEAVEVGGVADRERLRDRDQHALARLPFVERPERERYLGRADRPLAGADGEVGHGAELRPAEGFRHGPFDADDVAGINRVFACHEHALRRVRVRIGSVVLLLDEEAAQAARALEVADHDALDLQPAAGYGGLGAVALNVVYRRLLAVAASGSAQLLAAPGVIGRSLKSTSLRSVSLPSAQRESPSLPSSLPAPEPSV